jgi:hypothetical protein
MKLLNQKPLIAIIAIFFIPIVIKSHNLKLTYKVENIQNEIKKIEIENQYLKKNMYSNISLSKIRTVALLNGFAIPQPYTIVMIDQSEQKIQKDKNLFAKITHNIFKNRNL